ncbi:hypothetical protein [Corynebacterium lowii]|uniref:SWIM-type domain-containing protein n=1 Tax=Corynebacterium lowii TaxID=1544413 RepID=A0A0Q0YI56_9CORY|nr:hypothetical protein [Corynebacterium lowii]KQB86334.1 hypothetical protein Clow_01253 [Corynebacterium lowii]MDP9850819.1 putative Zn finger protein [Corynebacterium lowii]
MTEDKNNPPRSTRPRRDNVIYANFGSKKSGGFSTEPPTRHEVTPQRRYPSAAQWLIDALAPVDSGRLKRGRDYMRTGHVLSHNVEHGRITGVVAGSHNEPFHVTVSLPHRSTDDLSRAIRALASRSGALSRARKGDLDAEVLDALVGEPVTFRCECPDPTTICKHAVATAEVAAERIAQQPEMLFKLRGLDMAWVERQMVEEAKQVGKESSQATDDRFWQGRTLPELPDPAPAPAIEDSDINLLHQAMRTVSYTAVEQLRAVADIEDMYDYLLRR